jgi:hypothetical protein
MTFTADDRVASGRGDEVTEVDVHHPDALRDLAGDTRLTWSRTA